MDTPIQRVSVRVPATTANCGPLYDVGGMAINMWNDLTVQRSDVFQLTISGEGKGVLSTDQTNLVMRGIAIAYRVCKKPVPTLHVQCTNRIPTSRGLGSSAAAIVSGILAGLALENHSLTANTEEDLLNLA